MAAVGAYRSCELVERLSTSLLEARTNFSDVAYQFFWVIVFGGLLFFALLAWLAVSQHRIRQSICQDQAHSLFASWCLGGFLGQQHQDATFPLRSDPYMCANAHI